MRATLFENLEVLTKAHVILNHRSFGCQLSIDLCFCEVAKRHQEIRTQFEQMSLDLPERVA